MRVAVAGGTGTVGRHVVTALARLGHEPVPLSRSGGVDVVTGQGLAAALDGVEAVVDASSTTALGSRACRAFFGGATRQLLAAGEAAGVGHHVVLSIVGAERVRVGHYAGKLLQEELALAGPLPVTLLRTTQFQAFPGQLLERSPGPLVVVPRLLVQPVDEREVGTALAALAVGPPQSRVAELAGESVHPLPALVRLAARDRADRRPVLGLPVPVARDALLPRSAAH